MHRLWAPLLIALLFVMPVAAHAAATLPLLDPDWHLVPDAHDYDADCPVGAPLGFGGVLQGLQNLMNAGISLGVIICVLIIAFAGFLWILTPTNPENHSKARAVLTNAAIGLLILLSAWLIVDFVMKLLYRGDTYFGPWNEILTGGDICVVANDNVKSLVSGEIIQTPGLGGGLTVPQTGPGACNSQTLMSAAQKAGIELSQTEANTFACIARSESTCGTRNLNYNWGRGSSAAGAFQVLLDGNSQCYENAACRAAAGVSGPLNCSAGFRNGNPIPGSPIVQRCVNAASNLSCSIAAAKCVKDKQGYGAWTADKNSSNQRRCIAG